MSILCAFFDILGDNGYVLEIKRCVNLIHDIQWRRLVVVQREYKSERRQGLFTTGKVLNMLPGLFRGTNGEDDAFVEGVESVEELELGVTTHSKHLR